MDETVAILRGLKARYEAHHGVKYTAVALTTAAELSARFINDRHLPDKAIDVIDEAGAAQRILPKSRQRKVISKHEIESIIAKIARIPAQNVSSDDRNTLKTLDRDLKAVVFGQDKAINALTAAIKMARSGLGNPQKPVGSFLFSGPTGVGKTEVAQAACLCTGHSLASLRHVRIHGAACGIPPDRRAARICRFRSGRFAHRGDYQAALFGTAAG